MQYDLDDTPATRAQRYWYEGFNEWVELFVDAESPTGILCGISNVDAPHTYKFHPRFAHIPDGRLVDEEGGGTTP